jgi:hypothetical protein
VDDIVTDDIWSGSTTLAERLATDIQPQAGADFATLPANLAREKSYQQFRRDLSEHLYRSCALQLWSCELLDLTSKPEETEAEFRRRMEPNVVARRADEMTRIEQQYSTKLARLDARIQAAESKLKTQKWQVWARASGILWALAEAIMRIKGVGRRGRPRSAVTAMRGVATEHGQQASAQVGLEKLVAEKQALVLERDEQLAAIEDKLDPQRFAVNRLELKPRKADIDVDSVMLVWLPWQIDSQGGAEALFDVRSVLASGPAALTAEAEPIKTGVAPKPLARG